MSSSAVSEAGVVGVTSTEGSVKAEYVSLGSTCLIWRTYCIACVALPLLISHVAVLVVVEVQLSRKLRLACTALCE